MHIDAPRSIPPNDRERERIAVRNSERQRRFRYGSEPPPNEPETDAAFLPFEEVIGWIAYRRFKALEGGAPGVTGFYQRWKLKTIAGGSSLERRCSLVEDLRRIIARVRWWQRNKRQGRPPASGWLHRLHPIRRHHVRWALRHHGGPADTVLAALRADVRQLLAAEAAHAGKIADARRVLIAEIAAERVVALGRPGVWRTRHFKSAKHEPIPPEFFANAHSTILLDGWASCADGISAADWAEWTGPEWGDVVFKRAEVMRHWPAVPAVPIEEVSTGDLAPFLTLMQAVAWVATHDPAVVLRASLDAADSARASAALGDTSDWCDGAPGLGFHALNLRTVKLDAAERALAALDDAVHRAQVKSSALPYDLQTKIVGRAVELNTRDWAELKLQNPDPGSKEVSWSYLPRDNAASAEPSVRWTNVGIETASLLAKWPGASQEQGEHTAAPFKESAPSEFKGNPRGPRPVRTNAAMNGMLADYAAAPDRLASETEETLASLYDVSRSTARDARKRAMLKLRQTPT